MELILLLLSFLALGAAYYECITHHTAYHTLSEVAYEHNKINIYLGIIIFITNLRNIWLNYGGIWHTIALHLLWFILVKLDPYNIYKKVIHIASVIWLCVYSTFRLIINEIIYYHTAILATIIILIAYLLFRNNNSIFAKRVMMTVETLLIALFLCAK